MKIVVVTNYGTAYVVKVDEDRNTGGLNLNGDERVVASFPYAEKP